MDLFAKDRARIDYLMAQTLKIVQERYAQSEQMFTVASAWGQIIFVLQNLAQFILFFIEDSITELNIITATRESSIYGIAASVGHNATRASSAVGEIQLVWNNADPSEVGGNAILIPNKSVLKFSDTGSRFILNLTQDYVRFNINSSTKINCQIIQGEIKTANFTGEGTPLQSFNVREKFSGSIENNNVSVYVDDTLCKNYVSLYDMPFNSKSVMIRTSINQGIDIIFGNGKMGFIPPSGSNIRVEYIETTGFSGNVQGNINQVRFEFDDEGTDLYGNTITLNDYIKVNCTVIPQLGANQESLRLTKILAPKTSRNYILANPENYITYFEKFGTFSIIEAFNNINGTYLDDQSIVYVLLVPDVNLKLSSNQNYFNLLPSDFKLSEYQKSSIINVIDKSGQKIVGTEVKLLDPKISRYIVNTVITVYEGYDPDTIKNAIIDVYSQYFISIRRRDIIPRSDLIALVESIPGVDSVMVFFVSEKNEMYQSTIAGLPADDPRRKIIQGLNNFGDIVMEKDEIVVISGGWSDSNGVYYDLGADLSKLSSVNIEITGFTPYTYNTQINALNKASIKG